MTDNYRRKMREFRDINNFDVVNLLKLDVIPYFIRCRYKFDTDKEY